MDGRRSLSVNPRRCDTNPLALAIAPVRNETTQRRREHEQTRALARQMSEQIDGGIKADRSAMRKQRRMVKVLLLGQSHAGKSTVLKNFQFAYNREAWDVERASWKNVIYLNLVRTINSIVDVLNDEVFQRNPQQHSRNSIGSHENSLRLPPPRRSSHSAVQHSRLSSQHQTILMRLRPLRFIQDQLQIELGLASTDKTTVEQEALWHELEAQVEELAPPVAVTETLRPKEFSIRSNNLWKGVFKSLQTRRPPPVDRQAAPSKAKRIWAQHITDTIVSCKQDIKALWHDPIVQDILETKRLRLEDTSGFFLDDIDRVASNDYEPSDSDVIRARLRTNGVQEYYFRLERDFDWKFYDFNGSRSFRSAWAQYFDDVQAVIFLAPLSPFDEYEQLPDGSQLNRLQDSFQMWRGICGNKVLARVQLVLFMNKFDRLKRRLQSGDVLVKDHVQSFGNRSNDYKTVSNYFRASFSEIHRKYSPAPGRGFFAHFTTAVDTVQTLLTLNAVREVILMDQLRDSDFI